MTPKMMTRPVKAGRMNQEMKINHGINNQMMASSKAMIIKLRCLIMESLLLELIVI
jgi:hypothetical protein